MKTRRKLISVHDFCSNYNIEISFINELRHNGLIEIKKVEEDLFIDINQVAQLETIVRLHYDLDINIEGIETIVHLLQRVNRLQEEVTQLRNRLYLYE